MGKIKKILESELIGGTQSTDVYPVTSVKAVYGENNERLDNILNRMDEATQEKLTELESKTDQQFSQLEQKLGVGFFDVSKYNNTYYNSLNDALIAIPISFRMAGMSIRYIQLILATYKIEKTEELDTAPTGTQIISAITNADGTYKASQIVTSDVTQTTTVQTAVNAITAIGDTATFYMEVGEESTTYTKWIVTKITADSQQYVQYRYLKSNYQNNNDNNFQFTSDVNWLNTDNIEQKLQEIESNYEFTINGYINSSGIVVSDKKCVATELIPAKLGDVFLYRGGYIGGNSNQVCSYKEDGSKLGSSISLGNYTEDVKITIRDSRIAYLRAYSTIAAKQRRFVKINSNNLTNLVTNVQENKNDINKLNEVVFDFIDDNLQISDSINGAFISLNGNIVSNVDYAYKDFSVKRGDIIKFKVRIEHTGTVCALAKKNNSTSYTKLISGVSGNVYHEYTYNVQEDCIVAVCFNNDINKERYFRVYNKNKIQNAVDAVNKIDNTIEEKLVKNKVLDIVDDNLTEDINNFYISIKGEENTATTGYYSKSFDIKIGAKITFTVYTHPNVAPLAKKISDRKWEVLVSPGAGFKTETFEYVATENMTLAASTAKSNIPCNIYIETSLINANDQNIKNLLEFEKQLPQDLMIQDIELGYLFNKIAVIGDSMSVATMDGYPATLGSAWLSFLAKRWNCTNKQFYAQGGTTCYQWLNDTSYYYGLRKFLADETIHNAYFIAYGHNDNDPVGEATDTAAPVTINEGTPSCPSGYSFCAYYKAIINQIRAKAPHAMIFCLSEYDNVVTSKNNGTYRQAIIDVANWYYAQGDKLVHHLDTGGVPIADMEIGTHYSTIGYAYIAERVNEEMNKVIYQYRADEEIKNFGVYNL